MTKFKKFLYISGKTDGKKLNDLLDEIINKDGKYFKTIVFAEEVGKIYNRGHIYGLAKADLEDYLTIKNADSKYMPKSGSSTGSGDGASLSISQTGSFNNYGNNGQAFNAVRDVTSANKYNTTTGSSFKLNAASFGVKDNGTTAFSHKKYDTFNKDTGAYTGARNTAVFMFSGNSGLMYAKNTGSASDVTDAMYKYVGVIDSPDDKKKVYSSAQVDASVETINEANSKAAENTDAQINALKSRIEDLENVNRQLHNKIDLLISKLGVEFTEEELEEIEGGEAITPFGLDDVDEIEMLQEEKRMMYEGLQDEIAQAIAKATIDYSDWSDEPSMDIV